MRDSALPWDTVQTTRFRKGKPLDSTIESLTANFTQRSKDDPNFRYQMEIIRAAEEMRAQKTVSLNIEERRAERRRDIEERLQRENDRRLALNLEPLESLEDIDEDELPDVLLEQAADIVTDLATMREIAAKPEQTARVKR